MKPTRGLLLIALLATVARADEPTTILLVGKDRDHAIGTHEYMSVAGLFAKCLQQTPAVDPVITNGWPKDESVLDGVDAIVLYTAVGGNVLLNGPQRKRVDEMLDNGVGLVAIHWATGADLGPTGEAYLDRLGGWFHTDFSKYLVKESTVRRVAPDHPISRGWSDFPLRDEYYIQLKFKPASEPIMKVNIDGTDHVVGWAHERTGGGRSFGCVCGHFHDNFANDSFRKILVNGILWSAGREIPSDGAPCAIVPKDLEIPPAGAK